MGTVVVVKKGNGQDIVSPSDFFANCGGSSHSADNADTAGMREPNQAMHFTARTAPKVKADVLRKEKQMSPLKTSIITALLTVACAYSDGTNILDDVGYPVVPKGMVRLHIASGMRHGGYYDKFFTVVDVPTNVYLKSPDWTPQSLRPIPLAVHEACDIYAKWRALNKSDTTSFYRIEIANFTFTTNSYSYDTERWYYVIWHTPQDPLYILLDGTLLLPKVIDLRTQAEKDAYEQMFKGRH